jgi:membrane associated rhomboid family serine protease
MRQYYESNQPTGSYSLGPGIPPPFIRAMLIANVAVFIVQYFYPPLVDQFGLTPLMFWEQFPRSIYQVVTYMFLHGGFLHILFNLITLWMFGTEIEYTWGSKSFGRFYIICGVAGALLTLIVFSKQPATTIGASGAVYGVLAAYWLMFPRRELLVYFLFPVQVRWAIPGMMILGFFMGGPNIAHLAHLGGAICGVLYLKVDWRWLRIGNWLKNLRYRRMEAKLEKRRQEAEDTMKRVDAILDRINEVGLQNLTKAERKFLEDASSQMAKGRGQREESR